MHGNAYSFCHSYKNKLAVKHGRRKWWYAAAFISLLICVYAVVKSRPASSTHWPALTTHITAGNFHQGKWRICLLSPDVSGGTAEGNGVGIMMNNLAIYLAEKGHNVTLVKSSAGIPSGKAWKELVTYFAARRITLTATYDGKKWFTIKDSSQPAQESYQAFLWLRAHDGEFDVIHFPHLNGIAYSSALAKQQGLYFHTSSLVVHISCPSMWDYLGSLHWPDESTVDVDFMERKSVEYADILVSSSRYMLEWMRQNRWVLPSNAAVLPNFASRFSADAAALSESSTDFSQQILRPKELVFYGTLEQRRQVFEFIAAVSNLIKNGTLATEGVTQVTFLGRYVPDEHVEVGVAILNLKNLARRAYPEMKIVTMSSESLKSTRKYIGSQGHNRLLFVLPSSFDNVPFELEECMEAGVPFVTADTEAVREVISSSDLDRVLISPNTENIEDCLSKIFVNGYRLPVHPALTASQKFSMWDEWYRHLSAKTAANNKRAVPSDKSMPLVSVVVTVCENVDYLQETLDSLVNQDYPSDQLEAILVDCASTELTVASKLKELQPLFKARGWKRISMPNAVLGTMRNKGIDSARGDYIMFMEVGDLAKPEEVSTCIRAMVNSGSDVLLCMADQFSGDKPSESGINLWMPLNNPSLAWRNNTIGDSNFIGKASIVREFGHFSEDCLIYGDWEVLNRYWVNKVKIQLLPLPLFWKRQVVRQVDPWVDFQESWRALRPILARSGWDSLYGAALVAKFGRARKTSVSLNSLDDYRSYQGFRNLFYEYRAAGKLWRKFDAVNSHGDFIASNLGEYPKVGQSSMHPHVSGKMVYEVSRSWQSFFSGQVGLIIDARTSGKAAGDGVDLYVEVNGILVERSRSILVGNLDSYKYSQIIPVTVGDTVRFISNPRTNAVFDSVWVTLTYTFEEEEGDEQDYRG